MENLILKSLSAENFASFAEPITFTTEADLSKKSISTTHLLVGIVDLIRFLSYMVQMDREKHFSVR